MATTEILLMPALGHSNTDEIVSHLRTLASLEGLTDGEFAWIATQSAEYVLEDGSPVFLAGQAADSMTILLSGEIQVRRPSGPVSFLIGRAGNVTGKLPFSRMKAWGGNGFAVGRLHMLVIHESQFPAMLEAIPSMGQRCVSILLDRTREVTRIEQQAEKLAALGKLAANLSHELKNPASAARSAASTLFQELRTYGNQKFQLGSLCLTEDESNAYKTWAQSVAAKMQTAAEPSSDTIATAEREDRFTAWLEAHHIAEAWALAPTLAQTAISMEDLDRLAATTSERTLAAAAAAFISGLRAERMSNTVVEATARIFDFITAIQDYSYMDQAPIQEIDVAQSLESVLTMFASRLNGVDVAREVAPVLPPVSAYGSELNQVWTELIENALEAMNGRGTLTLRAHVSGPVLFVEICDSGPGIPEENRSKIFEPFFTTKPVGAGLGLGLDTVNRIVLKHRGQVSVVTEPGYTCIQVRLPVDSVGAY